MNPTTTVGDVDSKALLNSETLRAQLSNVSSARASESTICWTIFGIFAAAQSVLLLALFNNGQFVAQQRVALAISGAALLLAVAWAVTQWRALVHLRKLELIVGALEDDLDIPEKFRMSLSIPQAADLYPGQEQLGNRFTHSLPARRVMRRAPMFVAVVWFVMLFLVYFWWSGIQSLFAR